MTTAPPVLPAHSTPHPSLLTQPSLQDTTPPIAVVPPSSLPKSLASFCETLPAIGKTFSSTVADESAIIWVNVLLGWLWPKASVAITQQVHDDLARRLQQALPASFRTAHFSRFSFGHRMPDFRQIEVVKHSENCVEVDLELRYCSDVDVCLDAGTGGITLGINHLEFYGRLCIVVNPLVDRWPLIGAVKAFFSSLPTVTLRFSGLAAVAAQVPGVDRTVQSTVNDWIRSRFVVPQRKFWLCAENISSEHVLEASSTMPLGVMRVRVLTGSKLAGVNWKALDDGCFTSDPYCVLRLGNAEVRTSTVSETTDPEWPLNEPGAYFVVYHRHEKLEVQVFSQDRGGIFSRNVDAFLGSMPIATVWQILHEWPLLPHEDNRLFKGPEADLEPKKTRQLHPVLNTVGVNTEMLHVHDPVNRGIPSKLHVEAEWFNLADAAPLKDERQPVPPAAQPAALLIVELRTGTGFPAEASGIGRGFRWRSQVEEAIHVTEAPLVSRCGDLRDAQEFECLNMALDPRLITVIDKLMRRGFPVNDIARIVSVSPDEIWKYVRHRETLEDERQQQQLSNTIGLQWFEALAHPVRQPASAVLILDLLDGDEHVVGRVGPLPLNRLLEGRVQVGAHALDAQARGRTQASGNVGSSAVPGTPVELATWLLSSTSSTLLSTSGSSTSPNVNAALGPERYAAVSLELAMRLRYLVPSEQMSGALRRC